MTIDEIITDILKAEGWDKYTNDPVDRGGPTKWGITLKAWQDYRGDWTSVNEDDIKAITEQEAREFYELEYVKSPRFDQLPPLLMPMVVDCGVNHGVTRASKWVQRAVEAKEDGVIGPKTLDAVTSVNLLAIYQRVAAYRFQLYGKIVSNDHSQAKYAHGWNNRGAKWLMRLADYLAGDDT